MLIPTLETSRLTLRAWRDDDYLALARMNADARVMEFFPQPLTRAESDALLARILEHWQREKFGWWALEVRGGAEFIGFAGLARPRFEAHFTPCVEIGWRLAAEYWGSGYATEAARAALAFGFERLALPEIVSFTAITNTRSRRVMERLGMHRDPRDDFERTSIPAGHPLRPHVLYRLTRATWQEQCALNPSAAP